MDSATESYGSYSHSTPINLGSSEAVQTIHFRQAVQSGLVVQLAVFTCVQADVIFR